MTTVIAFDVNETLLDLSALDPVFEGLFGSAAVRGQWFAQMLQLSFVGAITGDYVDFTTAQHAALQMLASRMDRTITTKQAADVMDRMSSLPAHPEVAAALAILRRTSFRVVALTNSVESVAQAQLTNASIRDAFDQVISADSVRRLKPAPEPYHAVAAAYRVEPSEVRLVAAHSWDVTGALAAGCKAAFVTRPGMVASPIGAQPDIVEPDIAAVVARIIEVDAS
jgi:2-haloacid dehalogenase